MVLLGAFMGPWGAFLVFWGASESSRFGPWGVLVLSFARFKKLCAASGTPLVAQMYVFPR